MKRIFSMMALMALLCLMAVSCSNRDRIQREVDAANKDLPETIGIGATIDNFDLTNDAVTLNMTFGSVTGATAEIFEEKRETLETEVLHEVINDETRELFKAIAEEGMSFKIAIHTGADSKTTEITITPAMIKKAL